MTAKEKTTPRLPSPRQGCIRTMARAGVASWWLGPEFKQQQPPRLARWQSISRALTRRPEDLIGSPYISEMEANPSGLASSDEFPGWARMGSRGVVSKLKLHVPPIWAMWQTLGTCHGSGGAWRNNPYVHGTNDLCQETKLQIETFWCLQLQARFSLLRWSLVAWLGSCLTAKNYYYSRNYV